MELKIKKDMGFGKFLKNMGGFTATELLLVTTLLSSIPVSNYVGARNKALQAKCLSNLRQIGMAVELFVQSEGTYPNAKFYSESPLKDPSSIVWILEPYGLKGDVFICPASPPILAEKGLTYLWNDELSGKNPAQVRSPQNVWMVVGVTALDERVSSHSGGYNILYADGHVDWSSQPPPISRKK